MPNVSTDTEHSRGAKYDANTKTVVQEQVAQVEEEADDSRLARILRQIANDVQPGIIMEEDHPSQHPDGKMPILDMSVSINEEGFIVYQHFEKPVSSKKIMNVNSAQSMQCKKNVHVQEVVRRLLNCSARLNWDTEVVPVLRDYMVRMMHAGYTEMTRKLTLTHALAIVNKMRAEDQEGTRPL